MGPQLKLSIVLGMPSLSSRMPLASHHQPTGIRNQTEDANVSLEVVSVVVVFAGGIGV